ncbi:hypothetical protein DEU56DRAFT_756980 [Suillus clintonianus]|uniref:uncharacterized protein n=1 Tax=Suillus clintonianus TaxID=1904413 RepID=UPI001B85C065|nr:uncharacterized protein DEU56DRAFT_756980 [Suillus clintonianus]KAG2134074.1 hypothetical protein DEU56DRAFT_756980 [Suillus clintonianus]
MKNLHKSTKRSLSPTSKAEETMQPKAKKIEVDSDTTKEDTEQTPHDIMKSLKLIPAVKAIDSHSGTKVQSIDFQIMFKHDVNVAKRLLCITTAPHVDDLFNIGTGHVGDFTHTKNGSIAHRDYPNCPAIFFIVGISVMSSTMEGEKQRQIAVLPCDLTWPRGLSLIGKICHERYLAFWTQDKGVTFSSLTKTGKEPTGSTAHEGDEEEEEKAPTASSKLLKWNEHIPTFDGKKPFCLEDYWKLPKINDEIENGTPVLVFFTASTYEYKGTAHNRELRKNASMNAKAIVLLANSPDSYQHGEKPPTANYSEKDLGIMTVKPLKESKVAGTKSKMV